MEGRKEDDVKLRANKYSERKPIGTSVQTDKDYKEPQPASLFEPGELMSWSFYRAGIVEFVATFLFLYITILTVMGVSKAPSNHLTVKECSPPPRHYPFVTLHNGGHYSTNLETIKYYL